MCQFLIDKGLDIVLAAFGIFIGYRLALRADARQRLQDQTARRKELLQQLHSSLKQNLKYLDQITGLHFKRGELPTFHLDTTWLHYFASTVCLDIPAISKYRETYNHLRFELDHINRKLDLLFFMAPIDEIQPPDPATPEQRRFIELWHSTLQHVEIIKNELTAEIAVLQTLSS